MPPAAGNVATAAASALAAAAVKAKVGVVVVQLGCGHNVIGLALGICGRAKDQKSSGAVSGDTDEEAGDQVKAL